MFDVAHQTAVAGYTDDYEQDCGCEPEDLPGMAAAQSLQGANLSGKPIRYGDGRPVVWETDLQSLGFGDPFSITRSWGDRPVHDWGALGHGWMINSLPHMYLYPGTSGAVKVLDDSALHTVFYDVNPTTGEVEPRQDMSHPQIIKVVQVGGTDERLTSTDKWGDRTFFYGFNINVPTNLQGKFDKRISADGVTTSATYSSGLVTEVTRDYDDTILGWHVKESFLFEYITSTTNQNLLRRITLRRERWQDGTSEPGYTDVRRVDYGYYSGSVDGSGQLRTAAVSDPAKDRTPSSVTYSGSTVTVTLSGHGYSVGDLIVVSSSNSNDATYMGTFTVASVSGSTFTYTAVDAPSANPAGTIKINKPFDVSMYRYYSTGTLKYELRPASYARLDSAVTDPLSAPETGSLGSDIASFADHYFAYDGNRRVTSEVAASAGFGTYTFEYTNRGLAADPDHNAIDWNVWSEKVVETMPDNNQYIVYMNEIGQVMLKIYKDANTGAEWKTFIKYKTTSGGLGRPVMIAYPSAVTGYDDTKDDLMNQVSGDYQYLDNSFGLIVKIDYSSSDGGSISDTVAGDATGRPTDITIQRGENGTAIPLAAYDYYKHTNGSGTNLITIYPLADVTLYSGTNSTGARKTTYTYSWGTTAAHIASLTVQVPLIQYTQNGPGTNSTDLGKADTATAFFNNAGEIQWTKDEDGYINFYQYDDGTGALIKTITDVDYNALSGDEQTSFDNTGWSDPTGGLDIETTMQVDGLGRTKELTDANGNVTYIKYNDDNHEARVYRGWHSFASGTNTVYAPTGPVAVARADLPGSYLEELSFAYTAGTNTTPLGTESFGTSDIRTLSRQHFTAAGQMDESDRYATLSGTSYTTAQSSMGTSGTNYYPTTYGYDTRGRLNKIVDSVGTIYRGVYDGLGRLKNTWTGTSDASWTPTNAASMTKTAEYLYDQYVPPGTSAASIVTGDSNLTRIIRYPGGGASARVDDLYYDWRDRLVATKSGVALSGSGTAAASTEDTSTHRPIYYHTYDNLDEVTQVDQYDGDQVWMSATNSANTLIDANNDGVPDAPSSSKRRAETTIDFDDQGRIWHERVFSVIQSGSNAGNLTSTNALSTWFWYDHRGNLMKTAAPGGLVNKFTYDGANRLSKQYVSDGGGDTAAGTSGTWTDAGSVSGDNVLQQIETQYDASGNAIFLITKRRFHNETNTGELGLPNTSPSARANYQAFYYDNADRLTGIADYGTNGGTQLSSRPSSTLPNRSDTVLDTSYLYNDSGWIDQASDPRAISTKTTYDMLGRPTETIADYTNGTRTNSSDQTTDYTYDGEDHVLTMKAMLPNSGTNTVFQTTQYVYGVVAGTNAADSDLSSNDLLKKIQYPDKSTGNPSTNTADIETFNYDALGETKNFTDRNGSTHTYSYDVLDRLSTDNVTTLGSGVDGFVQRLDFNYDTAGRPYQFTSRSGTNSTSSIVNQVQREYNGLGQLITEYQEDFGAVNTSASKKVQYAYTEMSGGANHSRPTTMTYPNGRILHYNYNSGIDDNVSRVSYLADDNGSGGTGQHLEEYSYLGLDTIVRKYRPENSTELTYIKESSDTVAGDAGDQYKGLDRFDRVVDQRWFKTSGTNHTDLDRFGYVYDRDSNPLYKQVLVSGTTGASFSELYHTNGASNGYDNLNRITEFRRGTLSDANSDGIYDTVSSLNTLAGSGKTWSLDADGNWDSSSSAAGTNSATVTNRTHNKQNEVTAVGGSSLTFDNNGNTTTDDNGKTYVYDAWNRPASQPDKQIWNDALGRRIKEVYYSSGNAGHFYYSSDWRLIQENDVWCSGSFIDSQYVWSESYIDDLVLRDKNTDQNDGTGSLGKSGSGLDQRIYAENDANHNVTSLVDTSGTVVERIVYDPYGASTILTANWASTSDSYGWLYRFQGGRFDTVTGLYHFRRRDYSPTLGRPLQADPLGYPDGANRYQWEVSSPLGWLDPLGLWSMKGIILKVAGAVVSPIATAVGGSSGVAQAVAPAAANAYQNGQLVLQGVLNTVQGGQDLALGSINSSPLGMLYDLAVGKPLIPMDKTQWANKYNPAGQTPGQYQANTFIGGLGISLVMPWLLGKFLPCPTCFVAGTPVVMAEDNGADDAPIAGAGVGTDLEHFEWERLAFATLAAGGWVCLRAVRRRRRLSTAQRDVGGVVMHLRHVSHGRSLCACPI